MSSISRAAPAAFNDTSPATALDAVDQAGTGLLAGNPLLSSSGPLQPVDNLYLPEPLADTVAGLLPDTGLSLLSTLPLVYRFDPSWRRDTYEAAVRLQTIVLTGNPTVHNSGAPEGMALRDGRTEITIERKQRQYVAQDRDSEGAPLANELGAAAIARREQRR